MATHWTEEKYEVLTHTEQNAEKNPCVPFESLLPMPAPERDRPSPRPVEMQSFPIAGDADWKTRFIGWNVMLAVAAGLLTFFFLHVSSIGVLGSAVTVTGIVAAIGLGHTLLWDRVFARRIPCERQRAREQALRLEPGETEPSDELLLRLNCRERIELLQVLEHSLTGAPGGREACGGNTVICRELHDKIRLFGT